MVNSAEKIRLAGNPNVMVCERGTMFGYSKLFWTFWSKRKEVILDLYSSSLVSID